MLPCKQVYLFVLVKVHQLAKSLHVHTMNIIKASEDWSRLYYAQSRVLRLSLVQKCVMLIDPKCNNV